MRKLGWVDGWALGGCRLSKELLLFHDKAMNHGIVLDLVAHLDRSRVERKVCAHGHVFHAVHVLTTAACWARACAVQVHVIKKKIPGWRISPTCPAWHSRTCCHHPLRRLLANQQESRHDVLAQWCATPRSVAARTWVASDLTCDCAGDEEVAELLLHAVELPKDRKWLPLS
jgi:hypothetical protein